MLGVTLSNFYPIACIAPLGRAINVCMLYLSDRETEREFVWIGGGACGCYIGVYASAGIRLYTFCVCACALGLRWPAGS